ncbi:hypothetical protein S83_040210, partial [Arachis hypogaea]
EACSKHPELVRGVKKRNWSENFTERWFMALRRVLHFLKSHKEVKDMDGDTYDELQDFWFWLSCAIIKETGWLELGSAGMVSEIGWLELESTEMVSETSVT